MAKKVTTDVKCVIDSYDLANCARNVTLTGDAELIDVSGHGDTNRVYLKGFKSWSLTVEFLDDFADNALNEKLFSWWQATSEIAVAVRVVDTTIAADNPEFQGNVWTSSVPLFAGAFGQVAGGTITFQGSGDLVRDVTA